MPIIGIFVEWIKYVEVNGSTRAMHFYLNNDGKSTQSLKKAKKFKSHASAIAAAKKHFGGKGWAVFEDTEFRSRTIAREK